MSGRLRSDRAAGIEPRSTSGLIQPSHFGSNTWQLTSNFGGRPSLYAVGDSHCLSMVPGLVAASWGRLNVQNFCCAASPYAVAGPFGSRRSAASAASPYAMAGPFGARLSAVSAASPYAVAGPLLVYSARGVSL